LCDPLVMKDLLNCVSLVVMSALPILPPLLLITRRVRQR
jgi:hypothetical protein